MLREVVEEAVRSLKSGKSEGVDNIRSELLKNGGKATTTVLTTICQKILETKQWPKAWTQSLVILLPKKGNLRQYQNYRTISLISHFSLLRVFYLFIYLFILLILSRVEAKAEDLLAEEQTGFRPGRSTVEQIFNSRVMTEKHLQHHHDLFRNFIDFKKEFDSLAHRPEAGPQKLQRRGRTGQSHSGTI